MKSNMVSIIYLLYGLINISIAALSSFALIHMDILGVICLFAGVGLGMKRAWSIYPAMFFGPLTLTIGVATMYSSIALVGFSPTTEILIYHLSLIGYSVVALGISIYSIANSSCFFK